MVTFEGKRMRLFVFLLEGREWAVEDSYVKLRVGKSKATTRVLSNTNNPVWNEEFVFRVHDLEDELVLSVHQFNEDSGFFNLSAHLVGRVKIPIWAIAAEENQNLPPTWFSVGNHKSSRSTNKDYGKILLSLSLHGRGEEIPPDSLLLEHSCNEKITNEYKDQHVAAEDVSRWTAPAPAPAKKPLEGKHVMKAIAGRFERLFNKNEEGSGPEVSSESTTLSDTEDSMVELASGSSFEELMQMMQSKNDEIDMPENLQGGILLDETYAISSKDLNMLIFAPKSPLMRDLVELQGTTDVQEGPWTLKSAGKSCVTRVVTYTKVATKLVEAVNAREEQTYMRANGKEFAVFVDVSTPEAPYGNTFKVELLYKITPGQELSSGEESAHLVVSWTVNFHQNTMMRGVIEGGIRQGLRKNFDQFSHLLAKTLKVINPEAVLNREHTVATLLAEKQPDWKMAIAYFANFTMILTLFVVLYVGFHIWICGESKLRGLEIGGLDLPDSIGEIITCGILVIQLETVYDMVSHFVQARLKRGRDQGVKAQGDGWVLTIALLEGGLASLDSADILDPYVVFTCNGKTRTSSVKLQTLDPQWNEILEFDASEEPPSMLDVEVFNFDGPFGQASSLGHAEINFLKHTSTELADIWVPLQGKLAQSSQSKLHLRIFLDNNNGVETIRDYLSKMEKEVGMKLNLRSPHRNSTFQKIFGLPPDEFLISDFSCSLKRKMPLQGRLFLSARIVGFYANLFGHKTKFFFLWEDIEDIHVLPPSLGTVGSLSLVIILGKCRGTDARHGAKYQDEEGRLYFYFHSFVSFNVASRTVLALWRTRTLTPDQRAQIAEEQQDRDGKLISLEGTGSHLFVQDEKMYKVLSVEIPLSIRLLMQRFEGGGFECKVISKSGCLNYTTTPWEPVSSDVNERCISFKFDHCVSVFGGEVTCTQQKVPISNDRGWIINEITTLHDVPFSDYFRVQLRYQVENSILAQGACIYEVYVGVTWLKSTKLEERVTRNTVEKFTEWTREQLQLIEREILLAST